MEKISNFLEHNIHPLIHGALLSRIIISNDGKHFAAVSAYQESRKFSFSDFSFSDYTEEYVQSLNAIIGFSGWISINEFKNSYKRVSLPLKGKEKALFILENDLQLTKANLFSKLYRKLFSDSKYIQETSLNENKRNFIRGFCELRGSVDTTIPYLAMDYFYDDILELSKARLLYQYMGIPYYMININFRQLQNQYLSGTNKRNTQLRIQLNWYANNIGFINKYKVKIIQNSYHTTNINKNGAIIHVEMPNIESNGSDLFISRLNYFSKKLFDKKLTKKEINKIRQELGFDIETDEENSLKVKRNREIVELVRLFTKDECAGCKNNYNISDRSFLHRKTGRPYFEIHHTISFDNNIELDHEDNLVKLCPVCHACLKRGVGTPEQQNEIIKNILLNELNVKNFAESFFDKKDFNSLIEEIYNSLR